MNSQRERYEKTFPQKSNEMGRGNHAATRCDVQQVHSGRARCVRREESERKDSHISMRSIQKG